MRFFLMGPRIVGIRPVPMRRAAIHPTDGSMPPKLDPDTETRRLNLVAPASWMRKIDDWRRQQPDLPNISEAIRRLVDAGLEATKKGGRK